jgi:hypothetical protein
MGKLASHLEYCALAASGRRTGGLESVDRDFQKVIQHFVIVGWVVMERDDSFRLYLGRKLESVAIRAVSPSDAVLVFLVGILSIVNQKVGVDR